MPIRRVIENLLNDPKNFKNDLDELYFDDKTHLELQLIDALSGCGSCYTMVKRDEQLRSIELGVWQALEREAMSKQRVVELYTLVYAKCTANPCELEKVSNDGSIKLDSIEEAHEGYKTSRKVLELLLENVMKKFFSEKYHNFLEQLVELKQENPKSSY
ncbi:MAG: hypothetical protein MHPSP_004077, partial [Paramarteilia canceri]